MTLTQTALLTKQIITISISLLIFGLIGFIGYRIWYAHYLSTLPPVEEKPDTRFGLLPMPDFPKSNVTSSNFSYSVDTSTGNLPRVGVDTNFEKIIKVYFIPKPAATLLSSENSKILAEKFKITTEPQILSETQYRFIDKDKSLTVDLDSGNFIYLKEATISGKEKLSEDKKLVSDFQNNLQSLGVLKEDIASGRSKVLKNEPGIAQISLWPKSIGNRQILTPQFDISPTNAKVYRSADSLENYLTLNFTYFPPDISTFATYPIKTSEQAFDDLKSGKGVVVVESGKSQISITSVYLAYYTPETYAPYLQPIFVFEGPHFVAYVSAVSSEFVGAK